MSAPTNSIPNRGATRTHWSVRLVIAVLVAGGYALTIAVFYPGYLTNDATFVYAFMKERQFGDWQSPIMSLLWGLVDPLAPGPASMFVLIATLYWLGFGVLAMAVARRSPVLGCVVPVIALMPPAFMLLGMIWRDILFGTVWLLAATITYAAAERGTLWHRPAQSLAIALLALGILLRPNAIVAAPLLLAYILWPARFDWRRTAIVFLPALAAGYALVHVVYYDILDVKREHPLHSLLVFDLGGITHFTGENQFPVSWSAPQSALLTSRCYDPERWDVYWTMEPCRFVMQRLEREDDVVFGTPRLTEAWVRAVTTHPLAYLHHRAAVLWRFLTGSNLTLELFNVHDRSKTPLAESRPFQALLALHDRLKPTVLFRVGFWLILAAAVCALAWRNRATPSGAFAVGVCTSAIVYVMTFAPFGVAADFRYAYWCVLATLAGLVTAVVARHDRPAVETSAAV